MSNDTTALKRCPACGETKLRSEFGKHKSKKDGLQPYCKFCSNKKARERREADPERARGIRARCYAKTGDRVKEKKRQQRAANPEASRLYQRQYYEVNRDKALKKHRRWTASNADKVREYNRLYKATNSESGIVHSHRRRARKLALPDKFTSQDWTRCLEYFNYTCAVCGRQLRDLFATHTAAADHWIALTDKRPGNPGTVPWNIVPLCHGQRGCNGSKHNTPAEEWLKWKFGATRAAKILERVNAYFEWVKQRPE